MTQQTIDLENFRTSGAKVFTGRDRGEEVRKLSNIDGLAKTYDRIDVRIPATIYSINPSFLEEFLVNVVQSYGKEGFKDKFTFISEGSYRIERDLAEAVERIIRTENALA